MAEKILLIEDDTALLMLLAETLRKAGYTLETLSDGGTAVETALRLRPDMILLDLGLPNVDGFDVCRQLREVMTTPVLMLTARSAEIDMVVGLEVGADDYLTKPFSMRELMARIKAMLRRVRLVREELELGGDGASREHVLQFEGLLMDLSQRRVLLNGKLLVMKPKEFDLLTCLAQHHGQVLSREYLLERVWGWDYIGDSRTVDVHIRWLRKKIEADPNTPKRIITVRGTGYQFDG